MLSHIKSSVLKTSQVITLSVASRLAPCSTRHSTMSTKPRADAVSSGLSPSRFFASAWQPAWQSARATVEYPCQAAQWSGVSCSWRQKHKEMKNLLESFGLRKINLITSMSLCCLCLFTRVLTYSVGQVWVGPDAAEVAHHIHVAVASRHMKSSLPRLQETTTEN